jgi:hypothetical protein
LEHRVHTRLAADREPVHVRSAQEDGVRSECERLEDIGAPANPAVHQDGCIGADSGTDLQQRVERGNRTVDLAPAVIRDDDAVDP